MEWMKTSEALVKIPADAVIVFYAESFGLTSDAKEIDKRMDFQISRLIEEKEITGKYEECTVIYSCGRVPANKIIVIGLGKEKQCKLNDFRQSVAMGSRKAQELGASKIALSVPDHLIKSAGSTDLVQAVVEGVELGCYEHPVYKKDVNNQKISQVIFAEHMMSQSSVEAGIERGIVFAEATKLARNLSHQPANILTPTKLANVACEIAARCDLDIEIIDEKELENIGARALLSVAKGSKEPPKMIVLRYQGAPNDKETLGLVGKGVTFDSGGIQIKPATNMDWMKTDMAGAAAVLGAMEAIGTLRPYCNVLAVIPTCENMPGNYAYRPSDVITSMSGKTIEVIHTDAEGRIILADGLTYAKQQGATKLVDIATLTGASLVALGREKAIAMGNERDFIKEVLDAAEKSGEPMWELPVGEEYDYYLKSDIADIKNEGGSTAGAIQGGVFLKLFAEETPWVHLDIAGASLAHQDHGIYRKGSTGSGTRSLIQLALQMGL